MSYKAFVCATDWKYHFPDDWSGVDIYFSEESIKERRDCVSECGIQEVVVMSKEEYEALKGGSSD